MAGSTEIIQFATQLADFQNLFHCFKEIDIFNDVTSKDVKEYVQAAIWYASTYFSSNFSIPIDFWSKVLTFKEDDQLKKPSLLINKICFCGPLSNATLEKLFSQMNLAKTMVRNSLSNDSLKSLLRIRISGITWQQFHETFVKKCVYYWYNSKNRGLNHWKKGLPKTSK